MTRRHLLFAAGLPFLRFPCSAALESATVRGQLGQSADGQPVLETEGRQVYLQGDEATTDVLSDERLKGTDFEAIGHFKSPDHFEINGIHTRSMFVHKAGQRLLITYWCDVCYIRTYSPGKCVCCQKYTDLDLRERDDQ